MAWGVKRRESLCAGFQTDAEKTRLLRQVLFGDRPEGLCGPRLPTDPESQGTQGAGEPAPEEGGAGAL